jgi:hypothetical protein
VQFDNANIWNEMSGVCDARKYLCRGYVLRRQVVSKQLFVGKGDKEGGRLLACSFVRSATIASASTHVSTPFVGSST